MQHTSIVGDLAVVMLVAALASLVCHWLRQPAVLGYILAGLIVGPHTPPFPLITSPENIQTLAELGLVMLMFGLGLEFSLRRLAQVAPTALIAGTLEILLMVWIGYQVGGLLGWNPSDRLFLGAMLLSSSTVIIVKVLSDTGWMHQRFAQVVSGILILDDIVAVATIALLSGISIWGLSGAHVVRTFGRISLFLAAVLVAGLILVPWTLRQVVRLANDEVLLLVVLGLGLGMALLAVQLGLSVALGAFLIGAIIGETPYSFRIRQLAGPVRDMFSAVFFVAVGLMLEPRLVVEHGVQVLLIAVVMILGKLIAGTCGAIASGNDLRTSLRIGISLTQVGEFTIIIAKLGQDLGLVSEWLFPVGVGVTGLSALISPVLIRHSEALAGTVERLIPPALRQLTEVYVQWIQELSRRPRHTGPVRQLLRKWTLQIGLNLILTAAIFGTAGAVKRWKGLWLEQIPWPSGLEEAGHNTVLLLGALLISMPLLIATWRKLRAAGWLTAEALITPSRAGPHTAILRSLIAHIILGGGTVALAVYLLVISSAILPSWPGLLLTLLIVAATAVLMWRSLIRVYAKAQIALQEVFRSSVRLSADQEIPLPSPLEGVQLESVQLPANWSLAGRSIAELAIRSSTGACIVAIERGPQVILNPGGDQILEAGDRLLLLGQKDQIRQVYQLLNLALPESEGPRLRP